MSARENQHWRFIDSGPGDGAFNMAVDDVLAQTAVLPTLRVYRWQPHAISIGYHQDLSELDLDRCAAKGVDVVRRPTGGRAILHAHEVTYSVILPICDHGFERDALSVYNDISSAIILGLHEQGLPVVLEKKAEAQAPGENPFACFAASARYEIHFQYKKLVGSAQRRYRNAILQHGSLLLGDQHLQILDFLNRGMNGKLEAMRRQLHHHTVSMETILKRSVTYDEAAAAIKRGFADHFGIRLLKSALTQKELQLIQEKTKQYLIKEEV